MDINYSSEYSEDFLELLDGMNVECEFGNVPKSAPEWMDEDRFKGGIAFFFANLCGALMCSLKNLIVGLSVPNLCNPLVMTRRSHTPKRALTRYIDTAFLTTKFYNLHSWEDKGDAQAFDHVNRVHASAARKLRSLTPDQRALKVESTMADVPAKDRVLSHMDRVMMDNLRQLRETQFAHLNYDAYDRYTACKDTVFSQLDMVMTSMAFFGSYVMFPGLYGGKRNTEKGLLDFVHTWRVFGHYMGIEDCYNVAKHDNNMGRLSSLLKELTMNLVVPGMLNPSETSIVMSKAVAKAYKIDFHLIMYDHCYSHGIEMKSLWSEFSLHQKSIYYLRVFLTECLMPFTVFSVFINHLVSAVLETAYSFLKGEGSPCPAHN